MVRLPRRNPNSQYLERGTPRALPEDDRLKLAIWWQIDERELGARDPWTPETHRRNGDFA